MSHEDGHVHGYAPDDDELCEYAGKHGCADVALPQVYYELAAWGGSHGRNGTFGKQTCDDSHEHGDNPDDDGLPLFHGDGDAQPWRCGYAVWRFHVYIHADAKPHGDEHDYAGENGGVCLAI